MAHAVKLTAAQALFFQVHHLELDAPLPIVYLFVNGVDLLKCIIGFILVKKGVWVNNIVASSQDVQQAD